MAYEQFQTIRVQVADGGPVREACFKESPFKTGIFKLQITFILKNIILHLNGLIHIDEVLKTFLQHFVWRLIFMPVFFDKDSQLLFSISIKDIAPVTIGNKNVALAVIVKVGQEARPTPLSFCYT